jgi:hypothetical protein
VIKNVAAQRDRRLPQIWPDPLQLAWPPPITLSDVDCNRLAGFFNQVEPKGQAARLADADD